MPDFKQKRGEGGKNEPFFLLIKFPDSKQYGIVKEKFCSYQDQDQCGEIGAAVTFKDPYSKEKYPATVMNRETSYAKCVQIAEKYELEIGTTTEEENTKSDEGNESSDDENDPYARKKQDIRVLTATIKSASLRASTVSEQSQASKASSVSISKVTAKPAYSSGNGAVSAVTSSAGTSTSFEPTRLNNIKLKQNERRSNVMQENEADDELPDGDVAENQNNTMLGKQVIMQGQMLADLRKQIEGLLSKESKEEKPQMVTIYFFSNKISIG
jgi:hypothetical protein